jgi:hypothetical protein
MWACEHVHVYACEHVHVYACEHVRMHACEHVRMYECEHVRINECEHVCMYLIVYQVHKRPLLVPAPSQMNAIHILTLC